ncbi:hypothetical protein GCM10010498_28420 [Streptomyces cavourensis]|nr:hypothetical protein GCM10010498_28420 [Streptomyces cavourensis]
MAGFGSAGAAVAFCVESSVTEASAAVVNPTAGVVVRTFVRGLRCDAKTGISFRGPPTGLAVGFGRNGRLSYGPDGGGTDRFTPVLRVGPRFRTAGRAARIRQR